MWTRMRWGHITFAIALAACFHANAQGVSPSGGGSSGSFSSAGCGLSATSTTTIAAAGRTAHGNSDFTITSSVNYAALNAALTAPRTWTLPAANALSAGCSVKLADEAGGIGSTNTLTVAAAGSDTINGNAQYVINGPWMALYATTDGTSKWTVTSGMNIPAMTAGGLWYGNASSLPTNLPVGSNGQFLKLTAGLPSWASNGIPTTIVGAFPKIVGDGTLTDSGMLQIDPGSSDGYTAPVAPSAGSNGYSISFIAGTSGATDGTQGGEIQLVGGGSTATNGGGGPFIGQGGSGTGTNAGGLSTLVGGTATGTGAGGEALVQGGGAGVGGGGNATLRGGFAVGGAGGNVRVQAGTNSGGSDGIISLEVGPVVVGATSLTGVAGEFGFAKISASGTAPGASRAKLDAVAGTNAGTCKIIIYAGTSTTPVTIVDNVGGGC